MKLQIMVEHVVYVIHSTIIYISALKSKHAVIIANIFLFDTRDITLYN